MAVTGPPQAVRVLIADDDAMVRTGLRLVLSSDPELTVVDEATNGEEAVGVVGEHRPDVVLMDLQMPVLDGVGATRRLGETPDPPAVLILTTFHLDAYVLDALEAGASGYLLKDTAPRELTRAIHVVADDQPDDRLAADARRRPAGLTDREREVAEAVAEGQSNADIAAGLYLGEATVKTHVSRILTKTGADNRVQIALLVYRSRP